MTGLPELYREHIKTLTERTSAALEAEGLDALVIHSGAMVLKSPFDDQDYPFKPVPAFDHWSAIGWPGCLVVLEAGRAPRLVVFRDTSFWEKLVEPDWDFIKPALEVVEVRDVEALRTHVPKGRVAFVGHDDGSAVGIDKTNPESLMERLSDLRVLKTPYEVECMAEASRIAARGHKAVAEAYASGERSELKLHLIYLKNTRHDDAQTPYKNIVALGDAAAVLHHIFYRDVPGAPSLLIDAGATHRAYASDITRTYAAEAGAFADLITRMDDLKNDIISRIKPGRPYEDLHDESHVLLASVLIDSDLVTCSGPEAVESGITRKFFPHGLGHSLGVQVHDVGCKKTPPKPENPWLRNTSTITPGQVFTIEPGLYFIDTLLDELRATQVDKINWHAVDALRPCGGIRIEDNVLVQEEGVRNLTREAFEA